MTGSARPGDRLQARADLARTLGDIAALGFREVELLDSMQNFGMPAARLRQTLDRLQLTAPSTHISTAALDDMPRLPDAIVANLGQVLDGVLPDMATDAGPASVVFVLERLGSDAVLRDDRVWAEVLATMCRAHGIALRGILVSTPGGVRTLTGA